MGQYWYIFSMERSEYLSIGKLGEFIPNEAAYYLVDFFALPVKPSSAQMPCATRHQNNNPRIKPLPVRRDLKPPCQVRSHLATIPNELILMIFDKLDLQSCFRLCLVSKQFWEIGWPFFQRETTKIMGPWAGNRVICLGDNCEPNDFPAGFLTTEEEDMVNTGLYVSEIDSDDGIDPKPGNLLDIVIARFQELKREWRPHHILLDPLSKEPDHDDCLQHYQPSPDSYSALGESRHHLPRSLQGEVFRFACGGKRDDHYPPTESWILRNLTTAEIVLGDELYAAFHRRKCRDGLHLEYPGFGEAIMSRICWFREESVDPFKRGVWAGHRFEICTEKVHASSPDVGWKDVTSEIIAELSVALELPILEKSKKTDDQEP